MKDLNVKINFKLLEQNEGYIYDFGVEKDFLDKDLKI